jgi:hypothetical protein
MIISILYQLIGLNKRSLDNIAKRIEIYKNIFENSKKKILSYTYVKEYLGLPISDDMIKYILKSTMFYDFVTVYKYIYAYIEYDSKNNKITFRKKCKPNRIIFIVLFVIFSLPFLSFLYFLNYLYQDPKYLILYIVLTIPFTMVGIFSYNEIGNRTLAIKLLEKLDKKL